MKIKQINRQQKVMCQKKLIAKGEGVQVHHCTCDSIHLTLGALTLRLMPDVYEELVQVLKRGQKELSKTFQNLPVC